VKIGSLNIFQLGIKKKLAKKVSSLWSFTYFCRMTSRKVIIEKNKEDLNIKMDNKRAA